MNLTMGLPGAQDWNVSKRRPADIVLQELKIQFERVKRRNPGKRVEVRLGAMQVLRVEPKGAEFLSVETQDASGANSIIAPASQCLFSVHVTAERPRDRVIRGFAEGCA
jgi:hypothetical protein